MTPNSDQNHSVDSLYRPLFLWSLPFTYLYFALPVISAGCVLLFLRRAPTPSPEPSLLE